MCVIARLISVNILAYVVYRMYVANDMYLNTTNRKSWRKSQPWLNDKAYGKALEKADRLQDFYELIESKHEEPTI